MKCLIENGYSIVRIYQEDVLYDKNNWQNKLKLAILNSQICKYTFIKTSKDNVNRVYDNYKRQCILYSLISKNKNKK